VFEENKTLLAVFEENKTLLAVFEENKTFYFSFISCCASHLSPLLINYITRIFFCIISYQLKVENVSMATNERVINRSIWLMER